MEKQQQKIFDCLKVSEELAKREAKNLFIMKNVFFSLVFILIGSFAFANNNSEKVKDFKGQITLEQHCENLNTKITLDFNKLEDFKNFDVNQIDFVDECTVDISIKVEANFGVGSVEITVTAKDIPCTQVRAKIKELTDAAKSGLGL